MVNDIAVQEFVNAIKEDPQDTNKTYNATVSRVDKEGIVWVNIHGSDKETPTASTSTEVKRGDNVVVNWRNNKLYIGGNYSNPSAGVIRVANAEQAANNAEQNAYDARSQAEIAYNLAGTAKLSADGKNTIYRGATQPSGGTYVAGDTWFDTSHDNKIYRYDGTSWVAVTLGDDAIGELNASHITAGEIDASQITVSNLDAGNITTGLLDADYIDVNDVISKGSIIVTGSNISNLNNDSGFQNASQVSSAVSTGVSGKADKTDAVGRSQRIYYRKTSSGAPSKNTTWLSTSGTGYGNWSLKVPQLTSGTTKYPYLYTAVQTQTVSQMSGTTCSCSDVLLDDSTTIIDGGNIITGTVTANKLDASDINASNSLTIGALSTSTQNDILNSNIDVGGRNLLKVNGSSTSKNTYRFADIPLTEPLVAGEEYTLQLWGISLDANSTGIGVYWGSAYNKLFDFPKQNGHLSKTFTVTSAQASHADASNLTIYLYSYPSGRSDYNTSITKWKLEKGNKATDWSQAPEDESGTNLLSYPYIRDALSGSPYTTNGITFTLNKDGTVTAKGTATANAWYQFTSSIYPNSPNGAFCLPAGIYTISGCPSGGSSSTYKLAFTAYSPSDGTTNLNTGAIDYGKGATTTLTQSALMRIEIGILNGTACPSAGLTFKPMIEVGAIAHPFSTPASSEAASQSATKYITQIDDGGIYISPANQSPASNAEGNSVKINASGITVYTGNTDVSFFGTTARIGESGKQRVVTTSSGVSLYDSNNVEMATINTAGARIGKASGGSKVTATTSGVYVYDQAGVDKFGIVADNMRIGAGAEPHIRINPTSGMTIWKGGETSASNNVANYSDTVRIGKANSYKTIVTAGGIQMADGTGSNSFSISPSGSTISRKVTNYYTLYSNNSGDVDIETFSADIPNYEIYFKLYDYTGSVQYGNTMSRTNSSLAVGGYFDIGTSTNKCRVTRTGTSSFTAYQTTTSGTATRLEVYWTVTAGQVAKILYTGANTMLASNMVMFMQSGQTATLAEPVSSQLNGIVLAWSAYESGAAKDVDWNYTFVPKNHVLLFNGKGVSSGLMTTPDALSYVGSKYVKVYDDRIEGYDGNQSSGTAKGITYNNNHWILRYVYGV